MTVLHILDHSVPVFSGYSFRSRNIVMFQRRLGMGPVVLTSPKHGPAPGTVEEHDGIAYHRTAPLDGRRIAGAPFVRELRLMARLGRRIAAVARASGADVLHAHSPVLNGLPAWFAGRRLGLPIVYEARAFWEDAAVDHGTYREWSTRYRIVRRLETFLFRRADAVVTICEGLRKDIEARGVTPARTHVVPNGVDTQEFRPMPPDRGLRERLGLNDGPVFGFVGSFYHYEGLQFLVDVAPELASRLPGARVLLVGDGPQGETLRKASRQLAGTVVMPGRVAHDLIPRVYASIDVFVCPRRRLRLTELVTPVKLLEAMAVACPVLASNVGGLAELIRPEVTGVLFEAEDRRAFLEQAVRLGRDDALRRRLGRAARADLMEHRTWEQVVSRYPAIYESVARGRRGRC